MLIETERALAMRCPACGKLNHQVFSLFAFSGNNSIKIECSCGFNLLILSTRDHKRYNVQSFCVVCEAPHISSMSASEIWGQSQVDLICPDTNLEIGLIGGRSLVRDAVRKEQTPLEDLLKSSESADYFQDAPVMMEILHHLQVLADQGRLFCQCGNANIDVDIYSERVDLHCPDCDSSLTIYGRNEDDLRLLESVSQIQLVGGALTVHNGGMFSKTHK